MVPNALRRSRPARTLFLVAATGLLLTACSSSDRADQSAPADESEQRWPDVIDVQVRRAGDAYEFDVTISSPYDTPERYADGWRVKDAADNVLGEHELLHDHAAEQPFTRTQTGVDIPEGVAEVVVEARDSNFGYGGKTVTVPLP